MDTGTVERMDIAFTEDECDRIIVIAKWYASYCRAHGRPIPPDPMRAILGACESMALRLEYIASMHELAEWREGGGIES